MNQIVIIGGGIVGLATAWRCQQKWPHQSVVVLEKEAAVAHHQTGHNSGVLHTGIYYKPGSLKAKNCVAGKLAMQQFCTEQGIPFELCGKVIVAVTEAELPALEKILARGKENGVRCEAIGPERLREIEPHSAGVKAIHVPDAGIVDYGSVAHRLAQLIGERGGKVVTLAKALRIDQRPDQAIVETTAGDFSAHMVVNCAGLQCDRITRLSGVQPPAKIIPFRGEYYALVPEAAHLCRSLIYPTPDPSFPFLGVHFTRMILGGVECGPNAVFAAAREGYRWRDVNFVDLAESLTYGGFLRLAAKHWRTGLGEIWRSLSKAAFVKALSRLIPEIRAAHLIPAPAGVRAQAIYPSGEMVDDFLILPGQRIVNVCNAPSPAATSSLNIGRLIVEEIDKQLTR